MRLRLALATTVAACVTSACGAARTGGPAAASRAPLRDMPGWYRSPPKSDGDWVFAPATATSKDLQMAFDRAEMEGRLGIATQLEVKYAALTRRFSEETGLASDAELLKEYEQSYKAVVSQVLVGSRSRERKLVLEGSVYRAWVLMEMPVGEASRQLVERMAQQQAAYARLRATEAYKELTREVEKYEASRKK
ncbi:MAG: hypothetical protein IT356_06075 [Gemmatimonadaceae bacterium]|nr:hypothetical protein [Gemmatimonadaceae bacterium]